MIVSCKECGKKYNINESSFKGKMAKFTCLACNHVNMIARPAPQQTSASMDFDEPDPSSGSLSQRGKGAEASASETTGVKGVGIRGKMVLLFIFVPVLLMLTASMIYINQLKSLSSLITNDSSKVVEQMAEQIILEKGQAVAREVKLYLDAHPDLTKEQFNKTPEFKSIAMQKVGETGYTLIVERKTKERPVEYMWVHPNTKLVGVDIEDAMKKRLGDNWARWDSVRSKDHITKGYYTWFDNREKYCAGIPIPGTPFNIVSSTYIDEFKKPVNNLQARADSMAQKSLYTVIFILAVTTVLVAVIAFFYGNSLSGKIKELTDVADRISKGEMDADIKIKSKDEIGILADAIGRMQISIRIFLEGMRT
ncbi:MAG: HAMP domain-containing protein [Desulfosarcinaceae bacterium]